MPEAHGQRLMWGPFVQRMLAEKKSMHGAADVDRQTMHQHQAQANFFFSSATQARSIGESACLQVLVLPSLLTALGAQEAGCISERY